MTNDEYEWICILASQYAEGGWSAAEEDVERLRALAPECGISSRECEEFLSRADGPQALLLEMHGRISRGRLLLSKTIAALHAGDPEERPLLLAVLEDLAGNDPYIVNREEATRALDAARRGLL